MRQAKALTIFFIILFMQGCGTLSGSSDSSLTNAPPSAPTGLSASFANQKITVSWDAVEGATSYNLYYGTSTGRTKDAGTKVPQVVSPYTIMDMNNGTKYYLVVTAVNSDGESAPPAEATATPEATWVRLGEGTNFCDTDGGLSAAAMSGSGKLYIVCGYGGYDGHQWLDVRQWDGSSWIKMGENIERTDVVSPVWVNYGSINLVVEDEIPWITWEERLFLLNEGGGLGSYYKVACWDGTSWVQKGDTLYTTYGPNGDVMASNIGGVEYHGMELAVHNSTPYLVTYQNAGDDGDIYVQYWDGSQWSTLGDKLDPAYGTSPQIVFDGDTLYVAWVELDITSEPDSYSLLMKYWDGSQWIQLGDGIFPSDGKIIYYYSLTLHDSIPYLAWTTGSYDGAHVSVWNTTDAVWTTDAYTVAQEIYSVSILNLTFIGSTPYLVGNSSDHYIVARYWDGSSWKEVNSEITDRAMGGYLALSNGQSLCIFWVNDYKDDDNINNYAGCVP